MNAACANFWWKGKPSEPAGINADPGRLHGNVLPLFRDGGGRLCVESPAHSPDHAQGTTQRGGASRFPRKAGKLPVDDISWKHSGEFYRSEPCRLHVASLAARSSIALSADFP